MKLKTLAVTALLSGYLLASCGSAASSTSEPISVEDSSARPSTESDVSSSTSKPISVEDSSARPSTESDVSSSASNEEPAKGWGEEASQIMAENLHGLILPYLDLDGLEVSYDDYYENVVIEGGKLEEGDLADYAALFSEEDGWKGGDISLFNGIEEGTVYEFTKEIATEEGKRFVDVTFYGYELLYDEDWEDYYTSLSKTGIFYLEAYDPFYYEFPTDIAAYFAYLVCGFDFEGEDFITPPAYEADYYGINFYGPAIYCYGEKPSGTGDDAGYGELLQKAGWTIADEKDEDGYYVAVSPDEGYQIAYLYDEYYQDLDIFFEEYVAPLTPYDGWEQDLIDDSFDTWGLTPYSFPKLEVEGGIYYYFEDEDNFWYYLADMPEYMSAYIEIDGATDEDFASYANALLADGWTVSDLELDEDEEVATAAKVAVKSVDTYCYKIEFYSWSLDGLTGVSIRYYISPEELPSTIWPAEKIAEAISNFFDSEDVLPAYTGEGAIGYKTNGNYVFIYAEEGKAEEVAEAYAKILLDAGYTKADEDEYYPSFLSPSEEFVVVISANTYSDQVEVYLTNVPEPVLTYEEFPSERMAELLPGKDVFPALDGADSYVVVASVYEYDTYGTIACKFTEGDGNAIFASYVEKLKGLGFTEYDDAYGLRYKSPNGEYVIGVELESYESYFFINLYFDDFVDGIL